MNAAQSVWKLSQELKKKIINFLAKLASRKRDKYQIEPITYVLFVLELGDECKVVKDL